MAENMQIAYDLCSLFRNQKAVEIDSVRKLLNAYDYEMQEIKAVSKNCNPLQGGKHVRDLYSELLIPNHVIQTWELSWRF